LEFRIECPRCRKTTVQTFHLTTPEIAIVETSCINRKCNWISAYTIPLKAILNDAPSIAFKLEHYGVVCVA